jgi:biopolymer transport protein ExbD
MASNANKRSRTRKRKHAVDEGEPEFQVAPMIDVLLVLTLFFMSITSTELLKKDHNLTLPDANKVIVPKNHVKPVGEIIINVSWNHDNSTAGFSIDGVNYPDANSLQGYLARQMAADPRSYALIRADKDVQYSNVSDVMASCASAGISKVSFAVITGGNHKPNAPAAAPTTQ